MKKFLFLNTLLILLVSCQTPFILKKDYLPLYQRGQLQTAEDLLDEAIQKELPGNSYTKSKDAVWLLLDSATTKFASGNTSGAISDYKLAIEAIDYYDQELVSETFNQILLQDDQSAYAGEDFEQVLARVYFALALIQNEDMNNALALLKQAEEVQAKKKEFYRNSFLFKDYMLIENPFSKYLMAVLLQSRGDISNAKILYAQTEALIDKKLEDFNLTNTSQDLNAATVLIVTHNGNAPYKVSGVAPGSMASGLALECLLGDKNHNIACSSFLGIPVPVLMQKIFSQSFPVNTRLCRTSVSSVPLYSISAVAKEQLKQKIPFIVAKGVARAALRRAAVSVCQENDPNLGLFADVGMLIANSCTEADTRTWSTLPDSIEVVRYDIPAGINTLHIQTSLGDSCLFYNDYPLKLQTNDLCIINVFNINPGVVSVQIPNKYKVYIQPMELSHDSQNNKPDAIDNGPPGTL